MKDLLSILAMLPEVLMKSKTHTVFGICTNNFTVAATVLMQDMSG